MITNKLNLPESFVNFYKSEQNHTYKENSYSVTELLNSIKQIKLNREYADKIDEDISDMIPALFGTAVHSILEKNAPETSSSEYKVSAEIDGCIITGIIDLLSNELIEDYKTCSVSKVMKEDFEDWRLQGLAYSLLCYLNGITIKELKFYALMKDWSKIKAASGMNYPSNPIYVWKYKVEESDLSYIYQYIRDKLKELKNDEIPDCSDEDRWYTGTKYAVYKKAGDKRAAIVCDSEEEAHGYITNKLEGAGEIVVRKGEFLKCMYYCKCRKFCNQNNKEEE